MRYPASEKLEIIGIVERSHLPVRRTLKQLAIARATFYRWYDLFQTGGPEALEDRKPRPGRVWNRIPAEVRGRLIDLALNEPEVSPRELAVRFTETESYFVSEASVPPAQGTRPDHQPGVHRRQSCRRVQGQDDGTQPAVADRLHLSQGDRLGMVPSIYRAR
jgi:transposase-like protein